MTSPAAPLSAARQRELADLLGQIFSEPELKRHVARFDPALADSIPSDRVAYAQYRDDLVAALVQRGATAALLDDLARLTDKQRWAGRLRTFLAPPADPASAPCPYPGLAAYQSEEHALFFGRGRERVALLELLPRSRWLWIDGASGVGKSSLVAAGLLPHLGADGTRWIVARMRPGALPLDNLARALFAAVPGQASLAALCSELAAEPAGLRSFVRQHTPDGARFLLWVDQLEEARTFAEPEQARRLDAALAGALDDEEPRFHLVTTIRVDQVGDLLDTTRELGRRINLPWVRRYSLLPIDADDLQEVIEAPAQARGRRFQAGLAATIRDDVVAMLAESSEGSLPLLAHALRELWLACADRPELDVEAYQRIGGLDGALTRSAEEALAELERIDPSARERVQRLLLALTTVDRRRRWTRQTIPRTRALDVLGGERAAAVLAGLSGQHIAAARPLMRLIATAGHGDQARVDLIHEALLTRWDTLNRWLAAAEEAKRRSTELHEAAVQWHQYGRQREALPGGRLRDSYLAAALSEEDRPLDEAFQAALRADADEERRQQRFRRRRTTIIITALATLSVLLGVQTYRAMVGLEAAVAAEDTATIQRKRAEDTAIMLAQQGVQLERNSAAVHRLLATTLTQSQRLLAQVEALQREHCSEDVARELLTDATTLANTLALTSDLLAGRAPQAGAGSPATALADPGSTAPPPGPATAPTATPASEPPVDPRPAAVSVVPAPTATAPASAPPPSTSPAPVDVTAPTTVPPSPAANAPGTTPTTPDPVLATDEPAAAEPQIDCSPRMQQVDQQADLDGKVRALHEALDCLGAAYAIAPRPEQRKKLAQASKKMLTALDGILDAVPDRQVADKLLRRFEQLPVDAALAAQLAGLRLRVPLPDDRATPRSGPLPTPTPRIPLPTKIPRPKPAGL